MKHNVETLNNISIIDVARRLGIDVKNNKALCFMHIEKTPSLNFNLSKNYFNCFGCGQGGNVISLVEEFYGCDFNTACEWLEEQYGINQNSKPHKLIPKNVSVKMTSNVIPKIDVDFEANLAVLEMLQLDDKAIDYLINTRKIPLEVVEKMKIKSISKPREFYKDAEILIGKEAMIKNGFYSTNTTTGELKQVWYNEGIVFPYFNFDNNLHTFAMRTYFTNKSRYYYLSSAICLYNENSLAKLQPNDKLFICEGIVDTLSLIAIGMNSVAVPGIGTFKDEWYKLVENLDNIIVFDNEESAQEKAVNLEKKLAKKCINAQVNRLQGYKDINEMYIDQLKEREGY